MMPVTLCAGHADGSAAAIAPPRPRSIAVVGNAPGLADHSRAIDAADWVVRFNNAAGHGSRTGSRVTHLFLVNFGGQMREWLDDNGFLDRPALRSAGEFLFPVHPGDAALRSPRCAADRIGFAGEPDWTHEALVALRRFGRPIRVLSDLFHQDCRRALSREGGAGAELPVPSTGFLAVRHLLTTFGDRATIDCYGFGFAGWNGHDWDAERRWFERGAAEGRLVLHPPG